MQIHVRLFARARDLAGTDSLEMTLPDGCSVGEAKKLILSQTPELAKLMPQLLIAVDGHYASDQTPLKDGCELACFPAVSGG